MKRAADKLIDIAAARAGTKGKAKPKSKASTKRTTTAKAAKPGLHPKNETRNWGR